MQDKKKGGNLIVTAFYLWLNRTILKKLIGNTRTTQLSKKSNTFCMRNRNTSITSIKIKGNRILDAIGSKKSTNLRLELAVK